MISARIPAVTVARLRELARASERTLSGELRVAVVEHLLAAESKETTT